MKKQKMKMTAMAAGIVAGMIASMSAAHAGVGDAATLQLSAAVTKTTCQIDTGTGSNSVGVPFGSFTADEIFAYTKATPLAGNPVTLNFSHCSGEDIAAGSAVNLHAEGVMANGSGGDAYGDSASNKGIGFNIQAAWTDTGTSSTAGSGLFSPGNPDLEIFNVPSAESTVTVNDLQLPSVTLTPQLFSFASAVTDIPAQNLQVPVTLSIAYN
ncbi:hypothetical protein QNZ47_000761 [Enterobacter cloacae]|nr:hypothetical protein [Enterobacter cloacae]